jgi:hypothetical protein
MKMRGPPCPKPVAKAKSPNTNGLRQLLNGYVFVRRWIVYNTGLNSISHLTGRCHVPNVTLVQTRASFEGVIPTSEKAESSRLYRQQNNR